MRKLGLLMIFLVSRMAIAGGDSATAKVEKVRYLASGKLLVDFKWQDASGFIDGTKQTRLLFDLYKFKNASLASESKMPKTSFEDCANLLIEAYKSGSGVELGQMGGGALAASLEQAEAVVVPYAKVVTTKAGQRACLVVAEPIK